VHESVLAEIKRQLSEQSERKTCLFCGATDKLTREHILGQWMAPLFAGKGPGYAEIKRPDGSTERFPTKFFEQSVRVPCSRCNNGWMSELESSVKEFLGPMIQQGRATRLTLHAQERLATWAVKTSLMFQSIHPNDRVAPDKAFSDLFKAQRPPDGFAVFLAHRRTFTDNKGRELLASSSGQAIAHIGVLDHESKEKMERWFAEGRMAYRITFGVGRIVFQVVAHTFPVQLRLDTAPVKVTNIIWPPKEQLTWPPSVSLEEIGGIEGLHNAPDVLPPGVAR
jgi:hypothetical protein